VVVAAAAAETGQLMKMKYVTNLIPLELSLSWSWTRFLRTSLPSPPEDRIVGWLEQKKKKEEKKERRKRRRGTGEGGRSTTTTTTTTRTTWTTTTA